MSDDEWADEATRILKAELVRRGVNYRELAARLVDMGELVNERQLANKIGRGTFSFSFFLKTMRAVGVKAVDLTLR